MNHDTTIEVHALPAGGCYYTAKCSCGWEAAGVDGKPSIFHSQKRARSWVDGHRAMHSNTALEQRRTARPLLADAKGWS